MAKAYITEHPRPTMYQGGLLPVAAMPPLTSQTVTFTTTTQSVAFGSTTKMVCVHTDSICSIEFGSNPTATTSSRRMAANTTEYFEVTPGHKVAFVTNT